MNYFADEQASYLVADFLADDFLAEAFFAPFLDPAFLVALVAFFPVFLAGVLLLVAASFLTLVADLALAGAFLVVVFLTAFEVFLVAAAFLVTLVFGALTATLAIYNMVSSVNLVNSKGLMSCQDKCLNQILLKTQTTLVFIMFVTRSHN